MEINFVTFELLHTPLTRQLLINFIKAQYEENADLSEESLKAELVWLYNNNQLDQLFIGEYLYSPSRLHPNNVTALL